MFRGMVHGSANHRIASACRAVVLFCLFCPALLAQTWEIEVLDNGKQFSYMTDRSMRLDAEGRPHIAYGEDWLYYAWHDGVEWQYEVADASGSVGRCASLALDAAGYPHISYQADAGDDLRYAYKDASGWHSETVDPESYVPSYEAISLDLDASGYPHISYWDYDSNDLKYAFKDALGWHLLTVDSEGAVGTYSSLALDSAGFPHISYYAYAGTGSGLKYAYEDGTGWHFEIVDSGWPVGWYTSIALDNSDLPHISYATWTTEIGPNGELTYYADDLKYGYKDMEGWHVEIVDGEGYTGYYTSLALDSSGVPCVAYAEENGISLRYGYRDASGWRLETLVGEQGYYVSLALDASGCPHLAYGEDDYYGYDGFDLRHAYRDAADWHLETVDTERLGVGMWPSLAVGSADDIHVSYRTTDVLRYAARSDELSLGQTVDMGGATNGETSLAMDASLCPHISYRRSGDLKYAYSDATGWHTQSVDTQGDVGWYSSLALDGAGYPHISYCDDTDEDLKFAYSDATGWHIQAIDTEGQTGRYTSLALDAAGYPHIAYFDNTNDALMYAVEDDAGWHIQTADSPGIVVATALALDGSDYPHIGYDVDAGAGSALKYARGGPAGWSIEIVESHTTSLYHYGISMAIDPAECVHVSYYDGAPNYDLRYAFRDETGWHFQTVDDECHVGLYSSLALDSANYVHICYYDDTNKDLKHARMVSPPVVVGSTLLAAGHAVPGDLTALAVWPNPARGVVHARLAGVEGQGTVRLSVVDLLGRRVMSLKQPGTMGSEGTLTLRLPESVPTGQYFLGVEGDGSRQFVPITVVK
jgi:hypothetical protein